MRTPLILLSGLLSNQVLWQHQIAHLSDLAEIREISCSQNTPQAMVQAILEASPPQFALAGHSMGGWLCLEVMRAAPERVLKLCLLNTTVRMDPEEKTLRRQKMIQRAQEGRFQDVVKELSERFVSNQKVKPEVEKMLVEEGAETFIHQQQAMMARRESESILPTIQCPTLVVHARQDLIFSLEEHQELTQHIRNAKLAIVEDSGHMSPMEMPQAITSLLRFWLAYF